MPQRKQAQRNVPNRPAENTSDEKELVRFSLRYFLAMLVLLIVIFPFIEMMPHGILILSLLMTLVLLSALPSIGGRRSTLVWGIALATPAVAGKWANYFRPDLVPPEIFLVAAILFCGFVVMHLLSFILRTPRVSLDILCAAIANYLMLGLLWSFAYQLVAQILPDSFFFNLGSASRHVPTGFEAFYFSFATLMTVGYGDIIPASNFSRMLAITESIAGVFYVTILVARLVAIYSSEGVKSR
ncbi:Ion channel [Syntrophus gentianae]|uniref:Ion channel n=1 Tax=Syntrophus gentianae TaxID=43775 RepID=A0A1H7VWX7_9BACT|nr:potassium channel family protein [Syntrophus gentianae]SEM13746.1 Ion channel [Syntrophus gentianae]